MRGWIFFWEFHNWSRFGSLCCFVCFFDVQSLLKWRQWRLHHAGVMFISKKSWRKQTYTEWLYKSNKLVNLSQIKLSQQKWVKWVACSYFTWLGDSFSFWRVLIFFDVQPFRMASPLVATTWRSWLWDWIVIQEGYFQKPGARCLVGA